MAQESMTDQEKIALYMNQSKKKLTEMLMEANRQIKNLEINSLRWCPVCGGSGIVPSSLYDNLPGFLVEQCRSCNGKGVIKI